MKSKLIKTKVEYAKALKRMEHIFQAKPNTPEGEELQMLALIIGAYEDKHFPIEAPDPVKAIKFMMDQMELEPKDLQQMTSTSKTTISRILNYKMPLSLELIRRLHETLKLPYEVLVSKYELQI